MNATCFFPEATPQSQHAWYQTAVFYHIYPLGMLGAERRNDDAPPRSRLQNLIGLLDHLSNLCVTALYIGPLFESSTHGYDTRDYYHVDRRLGTDEDFRHFVQACHQRGIRVIVDAVFNHVGREFWGFGEVLRHRHEARTKAWFSGLRFDAPTPDGIGYHTWEGHGDLVKLNLDHPEVREHLFGAVAHWIDHFQIDGLRLDAADCLTPDFIRALRQFTDAKAPDFYLMGEVIHGDYRKWANSQMLHGTTNYEAYKGIWSSHRDKNFHEIAYTLQRQFGHAGIYSDLAMYTFVDNHDTTRIASILDNALDLYSAYALLFLMPGAPSLYYGSEWGIFGKKGQGYEADYPVRPHITIQDAAAGNLHGIHGRASLCEAIAKLARCRRQCPTLADGTYRQIAVSSQWLVFERSGDETVLCAVSALPTQQDIVIPAPDGRYLDILNGGEVEAKHGRLSLELYPNWARVLKRL